MDDLTLLKCNGMFLSYIEEDQRDYMMCFTALNSNPLALQFIPPEIIDDEMLCFVIASGEKYLDLIPFDALSAYHIQFIRLRYPYAQVLMEQPFCMDEIAKATLNQLYSIVGRPIDSKL